MAKLIGTAGHVDHGKTSLIRALTGIDADRLPEEKARGLTIDLGFAHLELPGVGQASIVDVPGHERFVTNMLVGALGIDVALLCIAADESVMPQTREHFQILCLLPVQKLVVALTKADLVDAETLELASLEVNELLAPTRFAASPIIPVSSVTGAGLEELTNALATALREPDVVADEAWYLPIDRSFSVKGHGAVVTGTLMRGVVHEGSAAVVEPGGHAVKIRQIQGHSAQHQTRERGQRTALNLSGLRLESLHRGQVVGTPGTVFETTNLEASLEWVDRPKHGARVRVSIGADEVIGRAFLDANEETYVRIKLERPTAAVRGQPIVLRRYSPPSVLGGGKVTVPVAVAKRRRDQASRVEGLSLDDAVRDRVERSNHGIATEEVCRLLGRSPQALGDVFERSVDSGALLGFAGLWFTPSTFSAATVALKQALVSLHDASPEKLLFPRESVVRAAGFKWTGKPLDRIVARLVEQGILRSNGPQIGLAERAAQLKPAQRQLLDRLEACLEGAGVAVPSPGEAALSLGVPVQAVEAMLRFGHEAGELVRLTDSIWYTRNQVGAIVQRARQKFGSEPFSAGEFRDFLGTTRKYAIPMLEHLDAVRSTHRQGDLRVFVHTS